MRGRGVLAGLSAVLVAGCGSSAQRHVTLSLLGSTTNRNAVACGTQQAFARYPAPAQVSFAGVVAPVPSGRFKVKLKLKRCNGRQYVDADSQKLVGQSDGRFDGAFSVTQAGAYSLRATLEGDGRPESPKAYLQVG
jgi:hypothetical protein